MSKRKNTLNDLEEFLKLQASTLVAPQPVETAKPVQQPRPKETIKEEPIPVSQPITIIESTSAYNLLNELQKLAAGNKSAFYDHIIKAAESTGPNDVLLINTALYLKHGENWKLGIEEYWKKRKSS